MKIAKNIFNGRPNTGDLFKGRAMYLKGFNDLEVKSNYVRGWPTDGSGGIKARSGKNILIPRNYVDDSGILLYSHKVQKDFLYDGLKNAIIYGNHIVQRTE